MISRAFSVVCLATLALTINVSAALAAGSGDPTKIGDNTRDLVSPNAKVFWWIILVCGSIVLGASRKASWAGRFYGGMCLAGIVIYNPGGVGEFMNGIAQKVV